MFATTIQLGQIELFIDYQPQLAQQRTQQTVVVQRAQRKIQDTITYSIGSFVSPYGVNDEQVNFWDGGISRQNELSDGFESNEQDMRSM